MAEKINFTGEAIAKLTCPPDRAYVATYDAKRRGLCVLTTRAGHKSFFSYRKIDGRPERVRLGSFPTMTVAQARDAIDRLNGAIADGDNPAEERRQQRAEQTLADVFARYMTDYARVHKRTWADDEAQFDRYCGGIKSRRLSEISRRDIQQLHASIGADAPYAANRLLALLSKIFSFAVDLGFEGQSPARGVKRFREQSRERFLDADELARFFAALDAHADQQLADLFRLALFTGARRGNVCAARWEDVSFGKRLWVIPADASKSGAPVNVYLTDPALEVLKRLWEQRVEDCPWVFPSYGKTGHIAETKAAWAQILERAKLKDLRLHDLRRTAGSWLAMGGASLPVIGKALGHVSTQSTAVYARMNLAPVASAMNAAATAMLSAAASKPTTGGNRKRARKAG